MVTTKCLKIEIIIMRHKRLAKFALIKYRINFQNYVIRARGVRHNDVYNLMNSMP